MKIFHFTTSERAESIIAEGFICRNTDDRTLGLGNFLGEAAAIMGLERSGHATLGPTGKVWQQALAEQTDSVTCLELQVDRVLPTWSKPYMWSHEIGEVGLDLMFTQDILPEKIRIVDPSYCFSSRVPIWIWLRASLNLSNQLWHGLKLGFTLLATLFGWRGGLLWLVYPLSVALSWSLVGWLGGILAILLWIRFGGYYCRFVFNHC